MICPKCGNQLPASRNHCGVCGADLTAYKKIMRLSNFYYNQGLECAQVRDLSGAVVMLKKSLDMNKRNTEARNLLGLVYYEMGEIVAALGEWVISKHFQPEENRADEYMEKVQSNPTKLDAMNQAIKKYNLALESAKQDGMDLAILQLKKVVSLNPNFIRAGQLLALLYMKNGEKERARKLLQRLAAVDVANTTTLRYLKEITAPTPVEETEESESIAEGVSGVTMRRPTGYTEDKPNVMAWVTLFIGALIGVLVTFFLIVPTAKENIRAEFAKEQLDYSSELRIKEAAINALETESELWQEKYNEAVRELSSIEIPEYDETMYDAFFEALRVYEKLQALEEPTLEDQLAVAETFSLVDAERMENTDAKALYKALTKTLYETVAEPAYNLGRERYDEEDYEGSRDLLLAAYRYGYVTDYCYYYLAKSYQLLEDYEQAAVYYKLLMEEFPESSLVKYVKTRLKEMGIE